MTTNEKAKDSTKDRLLAVGLEQFLQSGYAATGIKEILETAAVPKGSFYHHFPSKEVYANEVVSLYFQQEQAFAEAILGAANVPPLKRLRTYFQRLIERYEARGFSGGCMLGNMSQEVADHSASMQPLLRDKFKMWQAAFTEVIKQAKVRGDLPENTKPNEIAAFLLNGWEGALVRMKADKSAVPSQEFVQFAFQRVLRK